jgi:hypothetical protein
MIVDLLARDARTTRALLLHAARELRAQGHSGVWLPYHDPRPWTRRALIRAGFLPRRSDRVIFAGLLSERAGAEVEQLGSWSRTYGDTDTPPCGFKDEPGTTRATQPAARLRELPDKLAL